MRFLVLWSNLATRKTDIDSLCGCTSSACQNEFEDYE